MEEKNRKLKKIITATSIGLLVIIIVIAVVFCIMKSRKYKYHVNENGTITIDKYLGHETDVVIPDIIKGKEVTEVGALCFYENTKIRSVDIPPTIQIIGEGAFSLCESLENVSGGENVKAIGEDAFSLNSKLINIPDFSNVEIIMNCAFDGCNSLSQAIISDKLHYVGVFAFACTKVEPSIIPDSMQTIGTYAFSKIEKDDKKDAFLIVGDEMLIDYPDIETVEIPYGVKFVSVSKCGKKNVKKVIIPNTVTFVDSCILEKVENSVIYLPESVEKVGMYNNNKYLERMFLDVCKIYGIEGSYAQEYAKRYGIEFEAVEPWY